MQGDELAKRYSDQWDAMKILPNRIGGAKVMAKKILQSKERYQDVAQQTNVPWFVIGLIHARESDCDFTTHLHNGDPLSAKTKHVPKGRPFGDPPFEWEDSAVDALTFDHLDKRDWSSIGAIACALEDYNGDGYRSRGIPSPYLWAGCDQYQRGKFVSDGRLDRSYVDEQSGCMTVWKCLCQLDATVDLNARMILGPVSKPVEIADPQPVPHPMAAAARSKTVWATAAAWLVAKAHLVLGGAGAAIDLTLGSLPAIKQTADTNIALLQDISKTAHVNWEAVGGWVSAGLLLYAAATHLNLKNFWLSGGVK